MNVLMMNMFQRTRVNVAFAHDEIH